MSLTTQAFQGQSFHSEPAMKPTSTAMVGCGHWRSSRPSTREKITIPMTAPAIAMTRRSRATPYTPRVAAAGVKTYTVYNHMLLATVFRSLEEDYWHLREHVQIWDVSCERQVAGGSSWWCSGGAARLFRVP